MHGLNALIFMHKAELSRSVAGGLIWLCRNFFYW